MANLDTAKAAVNKAFASSLPPEAKSFTPVATVEQITLPILNLGVVDHGAMDIIQGTFVPGSGGAADTWSSVHNYPSAYLGLIQNMAYGLSVKDQNTVATLTAKNQDALNSLVTMYEQTFSRITDDQLKAANVQTKIDYVTAQLPKMKGSLNFAKFQPIYNSAKADMDILANINSNKVTFGTQLSAIKANILSPAVSNGGSQTFDSNNNKVWVPGYNIDPNFPSKLNNGQTVTITIELKNVGQSNSSMSINGSVCGGFDIGWLGVSGSTSAEYSQSNFQSLMSSVKITLTYKNVCFLAASPSSLSNDNSIGWYNADILKQAFNRTGDSSGPYFAQDEANSKQALSSGGMNSILGFLVSTAASGTMEFEEDNFSAFSQYFHTESHASVNLLGFIPIASANTSYTKGASGSASSGYKMLVQLNNSGDANNLVVHGVALENPLA